MATSKNNRKTSKISDEPNNRYITHILRKHEKHFLARYPHHIAPGQIIINDKLSPEYTFLPTAWHSTHPLPIFTAYTSDSNDIVLQLANEKDLYEKKLCRIKKKYIKSKSPKMNSDQLENNNIHSKYLHKYAEMLEFDPDPYFSGSYNWYFTGNNMEIICKPDIDLICHVDGERLNNLNISKIIDDSRQLKLKCLDNIIANSLKQDDIIYELKSNSKHWLSVRQKYVYTIINLSDIDYKAIKIRSDVPFISGICEEYSDKFISIDTKRNIKIWDLAISDEVPYSDTNIEKTPNERDNWSCIRNVKQNIFSYSDRKSIQLYDIRNSITSGSASFHFDLTNMLENCEDITCTEYSNTYNNIAYIATTHTLFGLDMRYATKKHNNLLKWNHQLKSPPSMLSIQIEDGNSEVIAISGMATGDQRICETINAGCSRVIPYLPYKPYDIGDSFDVAKAETKCIDPFTCIKDQIRLTTTGISLYKNKINYYLLTQNSNGNIFFQNIFKESMDDIIDNNKVANEIERWDEELKALSNLNQKKYSATTMTNFQSMVRVLIAESSNPYENIIDSMPSRRRPPKWKQSIKKLSNYTDILAADMLSLWDISSSPENVTETLPITTDIVSDWLNDVEQFDISIPAELYSIENTTECIPAEAQVTTKVKPKRKYVSGF